MYLFLIIFYWTPPHFWALALLKQRDYGRAGVPMAPLVWGERETIRQMLWYTVILVPLTILPVVFGALGAIYLAAAVLLDAAFLLGVIRVARRGQWVPAAWSLYKFSLLYLALLFGAMVADRLLLKVTPLDLHDASSGDTLQLLIGGGQGEPEMLLLVERPTARGVVRIRSRGRVTIGARPRRLRSGLPPTSSPTSSVGSASAAG